MMGTNDSLPEVWNQEEFVADYLEFIASFKNLDSNPEIYVMIPPPLYTQVGQAFGQEVINEVFPELIP